MKSIVDSFLLGDSQSQATDILDLNNFDYSLAELSGVIDINNNSFSSAQFGKLQLLELKLKEKQQITFSDLPNVEGLSSGGISLKQRQAFVLSMLSVLKYDNKTQDVDCEVLKKLSGVQLFVGLSLKPQVLEIICNKLDAFLQSHSIEVLKLVTRECCLLPAFLLPELAKILNVDRSKEASEILGLIKDSLTKQTLLLSDETAELLKKYISSFTKRYSSPNLPDCIDISRLNNYHNSDLGLAYLEALSLVLQSGKIKPEEQQNIDTNLRKLQNHKDAKIKEAAALLLKEYQAGYQPVMHLLKPNDSDLPKVLSIAMYKAKYVSILFDKPSLCSSHLNYITKLASYFPNLNLEELGITAELDRALSKVSDTDVIIKIMNLLSFKASKISEGAINSLIGKLPFGNEELDSKVLTLIIYNLDKNKIGGITKEVATILRTITADNSSAEKVKNLAQTLYKKAVAKFQDLAIAESIENLANSAPATTIKSNKVAEVDVKPFEVLARELQQLNHSNGSVTKFAEDMQEQLTAIKAAATKQPFFVPGGKAIENYLEADLQSWAKAVKEKGAAGSERLPEILAGICKAVELDRGYAPRDIQQIAVLLLLEAESNNKGRLLQINTGEGKSVITAMLAAYKVLVGKKQVDIVTSSKVLAERDSHEQSKFFKLLGISSSHNCTKQLRGFKDCYKSDVVYGDSLNFQADLLCTQFKQEGTRGERKFEAVIVDEVDSMLIDEAAKIAKIATPICGMEHLGAIFIFICKYLKDMELSQKALDDKQVFNEIEEELNIVIARIISPSSNIIVIPGFLKNFVMQQSKNWAHSALVAFRMQENIDYVIARDEKGQQIISPVDYGSTGVVQTGTAWSNGLHQFLQVKHNLRMTSESLTTSFISNMSFFKLYGSSISGMTGTLGSEASKALLQEVYNIDMGVIPPFKPKRFELLESTVTADQTEHISLISKRAIEESTKGRSVLIIARTIAEALDITERVKTLGCSHYKTYLRSDDNPEQKFNNFDSKAEAREIIIATNLAGRGTDIITSGEVEKAGGLHVIITFMPGNLRVEEQALGRTSRQGNQGSGEIILNRESLLEEYGDFDNISNLRKLRDNIESRRLEQVRLKKVKAMAFEDRLFNRFNDEVYQLLRLKENNPQKLLQLEDLWGFWLFEQKALAQGFEDPETRLVAITAFEKFKSNMLDQYSKGISLLVNPAYMSNYVLNLLGEDSSYKTTNNLLSEPNSVDPYYSYQLHYLRAYSQLRYNGAIDKESDAATTWKQQSLALAFTSLQTALHQIESTIIPQLQSSILHLGPDSNGSPLHKQLDNKLRLLDTAAKNLKDNISYIESNNKPGKNTIMIAHHSLQFYQKLFADEINEGDLQEFYSFGLSFLYHAGSRSYSKDYLTGTLVAITGIVQVVAGAILAIGSVGFAAEFGIGLAAGGVSDIINGVNSALKGEGIDLGVWAKGKGIELAINAAIAGISSKISSAGKATSGADKTVQGIQQGLKPAAFGMALGKRIAVSYVAEFVGGKLEKAAARPIKGEIKHLEAAIRDSLNNIEINQKMQEICMIDSLKRPGNHKHQFQAEVLSVIDRKSSEFADIAQNLLSSTIGSAVAARGGGIGGAALVTAASTAVSVGRGFEKISELKDYLLSGIGQSATKNHINLPSFEMLLSYSCRGITDEEISRITERLKSSRLIASEPNRKLPVISSNSEPSLNSQHRWQLQTAELLQDIQIATSRNYNSEIDQIASNISGVVGDRMKGLIRTGIINPVSSAVVSTSLSFVLDKTGLEQTITDYLESKQPTGVSAGSVDPNDERQLARARSSDEKEKADFFIEMIKKGHVLDLDQEYEDLSLEDLKAISRGYEIRRGHVQDGVRWAKDNPEKVVEIVSDIVTLMSTGPAGVGGLGAKKVVQETTKAAFKQGAKVFAEKGAQFWKKSNVVEKLTQPPESFIDHNNPYASALDLVAGKPSIHPLECIKPATYIQTIPQLNPLLLSNASTSLSSGSYVPQLPMSISDLFFKSKPFIPEFALAKPAPVIQLEHWPEYWPELSTYLNKIPSEFGEFKQTTDKKFPGVKWHQGKINNIRIDKGNLMAQHKCQKVDHVVITYNGKIVDNTGQNYIMYDSNTKEMYKINREILDKNIKDLKYRFDIINKPENISTAAHPDAHISTANWMLWKAWHK